MNNKQKTVKKCIALLKSMVATLIVVSLLVTSYGFANSFCRCCSVKTTPEVQLEKKTCCNAGKEAENQNNCHSIADKADFNQNKGCCSGSCSGHFICKHFQLNTERILPNHWFAIFAYSFFETESYFSFDNLLSVRKILPNNNKDTYTLQFILPRIKPLLV